MMEAEQRKGYAILYRYPVCALLAKMRNKRTAVLDNNFTRTSITDLQVCGQSVLMRQRRLPKIC